MKKIVFFGLFAIAACSETPDRLVRADQIVGDTIPNQLTALPGDVERGHAVFTQRDQGHCVICHQVDGLEVPFQGNVGPNLSAVGSRLTVAQLRLRIVDYQLVRSDTLMPSYYRIHDLYQVEEASLGQPILGAQDVEDLVAYLSDLKDEAHDAG